MECDKIDAAEIAEKYVTGQLDEPDQAAFELHFVGCQRCFERVQLLQDLQSTLTPRSRRGVRWWPVMAVAASLLVAAGAATWFRLRPASGPEGARFNATGSARAPARFAFNRAALAMVSPPRYRQPQWRAASQTGFDLAMQLYSKGDYAGATPRLLAVLKGDRANSAATFFLGICHLMQGHDDDAIARLNATIALGDSPELEEAHFYLAKALLRKQDISGATSELRQAITLHGPRQSEERSLLESITKEAPPAQ